MPPQALFWVFQTQELKSRHKNKRKCGGNFPRHIICTQIKSYLIELMLLMSDRTTRDIVSRLSSLQENNKKNKKP